MNTYPEIPLSQFSFDIDYYSNHTEHYEAYATNPHTVFNTNQQFTSAIPYSKNDANNTTDMTNATFENDEYSMDKDDGNDNDIVSLCTDEEYNNSSKDDTDDTEVDSMCIDEKYEYDLTDYEDNGNYCTLNHSRKRRHENDVKMEEGSPDFLKKQRSNY
ncbi:hypothetical protein BDA99DRAFT_557339 [Phascolomyces articulosus]|uniref:Uncharacterized protein n=1 Tax=Phascolomyces articulosus TaxID=60185 RepID=A0AAD5PIA0_9FUNG|nr:hypothetical protein BDA99DRAFT_557337 [Phascolomyces articulosus]KAI9270511.1 hypothetical protein BDA99DRAFT_557339 [Phascolomyces articulosus]